MSARSECQGSRQSGYRHRTTFGKQAIECDKTVGAGRARTWEECGAGMSRSVRAGSHLLSCHAAQHESFATSFVNVCAASLIPSESVKYGWKVDVRSSIVRPSLIASAGSV